MSASRVLVTGAAGQLGVEIVRAFEGRLVASHTRASLDVTNGDAVARAVADASPDTIINCAAYNDVDGAESNPTVALAVNAIAVRSLARAAESVGATLVHYSTDFVFDGEATEPYAESVPPRPRSVYAVSKLLGEWFALDAPGAFVLRVESLFGSRSGFEGRRGTLDGIRAKLVAGEPVRVFADRVVSPSHVEDVATATRHLLDVNAPPGLYHCVNAGSATWYDVAAFTARALGVSPTLVPVTMDQVTLVAERPRFCALSPEKLARTGFRMPDWRDAIERWIADPPPPRQRTSST